MGLFAIYINNSTINIVSDIEERSASTLTFSVRFEVLTAVTMKNVVFWDVALCKSYVNRLPENFAKIFPNTYETVINAEYHQYCFLFDKYQVRISSLRRNIWLI